MFSKEILDRGYSMRFHKTPARELQPDTKALPSIKTEVRKGEFVVDDRDVIPYDLSQAFSEHLTDLDYYNPTLGYLGHLLSRG